MGVVLKQSIVKCSGKPRGEQRKNHLPVCIYLYRMISGKTKKPMKGAEKG